MTHFVHSIYPLMILASLCFPMTGCALFAPNAQAQNATAESASPNSTSPDRSTNSDTSGTSSNVSSSNGVSVNPSQNTTAVLSQKDTASSAQPTGAQTAPDINPEPDISAAETTLVQARTALDNSAYPQAFALAASSYLSSPSDEAKSIALYAASRLTPIELMCLDMKAETHFEQAMIGQIRLNQCASKNDNTCIQDVLPRTIQSLEMLGDIDAANRIRAFQTDAGSTRPVVAVFLPLSGNDRKIGRAMLGAMLQASGIYNHQPLPFDLRFFDTQTSSKSLDALMEQAKSVHASLILGPVDIRESIVAAQKLDDNTVMIGFSPNDEFIGQKSNVFQFSYALSEETQQIAKLLVSTNVNSVIAVGPEDAYTTTTTNLLQSNLPPSIRFSQKTFPATQTDLRSLAKEIAKSVPDAVFLPTSSDVAERITSFLAQENVWCKTPGTPPPKAVADMRKFTTCIATSAWSPISNGHAYKSIAEAIYLDYTEAVSKLAPDFGTSFENLYHRQPAVQEVMPFMAIAMLKSLPDDAWKSKQALETAIHNLLHSQQYLMIPGFRQVIEQSSKSYTLPANAANTVSRTLVSSK